MDFDSTSTRTVQDGRRHRKGLTNLLESSRPRKQAFADYRRFIQHKYDGFAGDLTGLTGILTGHEALAGRLISRRVFDVRGCKSILDAGCGNGRYTRFLLRCADADAHVTCFDLSQSMLRRARKAVRHSPRVTFVAADITKLPYPDASFDAAVCGWVLEHLPDPRHGLRELARVLQPGGKLLLMVTEDTFTGSVCSRMWDCRTYNRTELCRVSEECGLRWNRSLWLSRFHRVFKLGGILVELCRDPALSLCSSTGNGHA